MKPFPPVSPLENIYLSPINTHTNIDKPFIKSSRVGWASLLSVSATS